jgi:hypothetical protein
LASQNHISFPAIFHGGDYNPNSGRKRCGTTDVRFDAGSARQHRDLCRSSAGAVCRRTEDTWTSRLARSLLSRKLHAGRHSRLHGDRPQLPHRLGSTRKYEDVRRVDRSGHATASTAGRPFVLSNSHKFRASHLVSTQAGRTIRAASGTRGVARFQRIRKHCYCDLCEGAFREWLQERTR